MEVIGRRLQLLESFVLDLVKVEPKLTRLAVAAIFRRLADRIEAI